jgi:DNA-binding transcriptional LysR family regulator
MGLGIGWMPDGDLPETLQRPSLVPVLDDVVGRDIELHLAVPRTLAEVPKVRLFIEHLESMRRVIFGQPPPSSAGLPAQPKKKRAAAK